MYAGASSGALGLGGALREGMKPLSPDDLRHLCPLLLREPVQGCLTALPPVYGLPLGDVGHPAAVLLHLSTEETDAAAGEGDQADDGPEEGRFTRPIGPKEPTTCPRSTVMVMPRRTGLAS